LLIRADPIEPKTKGFSFGSISPEFYQESALMPPKVLKDAETCYGSTKKTIPNKRLPYMTGELSKKKISGVLV
jgi:hypothetical protein